MPKLSARAAYVKQALRDKLLDHKNHIHRYGQDMPEIRVSLRACAFRTCRSQSQVASALKLLAWLANACCSEALYRRCGPDGWVCGHSRNVSGTGPSIRVNLI